MNVSREHDIWLLALQARMKSEMYKKLKASMKQLRWTPEEFIAFCDQELEHIKVKYVQAVKDLPSSKTIKNYPKL